MSNKLADQDIPLLLNEELYILDRPQKSIDEPSEEDKEPQPFSYKGEFGKRILILVEETNEDFLPAEQEAFLLKILGAVQLGFEEIALANTAKSGDWQTELEPEVILKFGINDQIKPDYTVTNEQGIQVLNADGLGQIEADVTLKRRLWEALKVMFSS
jgi:hypothetical protein